MQGLEVCCLVRKASIFSSNTFILDAPQAVVVLDPGGDAAQTLQTADLIRGCLAAHSRPVMFCLSHCHIDHVYEILANPAWDEFGPRRVYMHAAGASALITGDRRLTQASLMDRDLPQPAGAIHIMTFNGMPMGDPRCAAIELGQGTLDVYATPGHSPDHVCFLAGEMLFAGDLPVAVAPLVAGVEGWNRDDLLKSFERMQALIRQKNVRTVYSGHGSAIAAAEFAGLLDNWIHAASRLDQIEVMDKSRIHQISLYAQELLAEVDGLFNTMETRLEILSRRLSHLEEYAAARTVKEVLQSKQVMRLLAELSDFRKSFNEGRLVEAVAAHKAIRVVSRVLKLLDNERLAEVLDVSFLRYAKVILTDFLTAVMGLRISDSLPSRDAAGAVRALSEELLGETGAADVYAIPDDPAGFSAYLVRKLAHAPMFGKTRVACEAGRRELALAMAPRRWQDAMRRMLEELQPSGIMAIKLNVNAGITVRVEFEQAAPGYDDAWFKPYARQFMLSGLKTRVARSPSALVFEFNPPSGECA